MRNGTCPFPSPCSCVKMIFSIPCPCCFVFSLSQDSYPDFLRFFYFYWSLSYYCHGFWSAFFFQPHSFYKNFCALGCDADLYFDFPPSLSSGNPSFSCSPYLWLSLVCLFCLYFWIFLVFSPPYPCVWSTLYFDCGLVLYFWTWLACLYLHFCFVLSSYYLSYVCF